MHAPQVASETTGSQIRLATYLFGGASIAAGILDLVWGEFEAAHQPIGAFGDHVPGQTFLAYLAAALLISGGVAVCLRRTARAGAIALGIVYLAFAMFWLPRFYTAPHVLGFRFPLIVGLVGGIFMQLILVAGALILHVSASTPPSRLRESLTPLTRWTFGVAAISFGLVHLTGVAATARMIPSWMPLTPEFWTVLTGIAFALAGLAVLARVLDLLAARLLALMLLIFDVLVLVRLPLSSPHDHVAWGANAYNLSAAGAAWIFAESIARRRSAPAFQQTAQSMQLESPNADDRNNAQGSSTLRPLTSAERQQAPHRIDRRVARPDHDLDGARSHPRLPRRSWREPDRPCSK